MVCPEACLGCALSHGFRQVERILSTIMSTASLRSYDDCRSYPLADVRRNCATSATAGDEPERHMFASFYVIPCFSEYHRTASYVRSGILAFLSMLSSNSNKVHQLRLISKVKRFTY